MPYTLMRQDALPTSLVSQLKRFPWYDATQYNQSAKDFELGYVWWQGWNAFMYVKADEALTVGQLVMYTVPTTDATKAGSTVATLTTNNTTLMTADAEIDNWVYCAAGALELSGGGTIRKIKDNAVGTITVSVRDQASPASYGTGAVVRTGAGMFDADQFAAAYVGGEVVTIIRPGHVMVNDSTEPAVGVALGTVTSGYYTIIQVIGLALVSGTDAGTDVVKGVPATPAAAGKIVLNGSNAAALGRGAGTIIPLEGLTVGASAIIPCYINLLRNC